MYDLYQKSVRDAHEHSSQPSDAAEKIARSIDIVEKPSDVLPEIKGAKSVTHDQFLKLRDGYIT